MNILITGNLGYVGACLSRPLRKQFPDCRLTGFDAGYFSAQLTTSIISPDVLIDKQYYGDVRNFPEHILEGIDCIVHLAAISNDPIGNRFEKVTQDINFLATIELAKKAKRMGVRNFVFASSCSVYGFADQTPRSETSELNPLTAYAKSKINSEEGLSKLADKDFQVTCLRFATACGMSDRLRLDLVLNDFVAAALTTGTISILSDGTPWRPLINTKDMARCICWALTRKHDPDFLVVNAGSNQWNYKVSELASAVQEKLPGISISTNKNAPPDNRSYKVSFDLFSKLAPDFQPQHTIGSTITELIDGLKSISFADANFRQSKLIRLHVINQLLNEHILNSNLEFEK